MKIPNKAVNTDSRLTNKYIFSVLRANRDMLLKQVDSKFQLMKLGYLFQAWKCVELEAVSTIDECCGIKSNCTIYRTKKKLPYVIAGSWGPIFRKVSSVDGYTDFTYINTSEWNRRQEDTNNKYNKTLYYIWSDGYVYFPNITWKKIKIEALFEEDIEKYNDCDGDHDECKTFLDNTFRIPKELLKVCLNMTNADIMNEYQRIQPDDEQIDKNVNKKE